MKNFLFFLLIPFFIYSKDPIFDLSHKYIILEPNDKKENLTIFGFNKKKGFLIIKVLGPQQKVILQKKSKFFGMWTWEKSGEFSYPALYHYYTNEKSDQIDFKIKKDLFDNIKLIGKDDDNLKKDLIEKKRSIGLFLVKNNAFRPVDSTNSNFFRVSLKMPYLAPPGEYLIIMELYNKKGKLLGSDKKKINVYKTGLNSFIFDVAHKYSFFYGLLAAIIALFFGIIAGYLFRKVI